MFFVCRLGGQEKDQQNVHGYEPDGQHVVAHVFVRIVHFSLGPSRFIVSQEKPLAEVNWERCFKSAQVQLYLFSKR